MAVGKGAIKHCGSFIYYYRLVNSTVDTWVEPTQTTTSSWSADVPDVIWTEFTIKWWDNGKILPLLSTQTPWHIWQWSYSPALSCCLVFLMYAENLEKISIPAVFDSRCLAASLGYLKRQKWRVTSCYQHHSDGYKYNLQEERKISCVKNCN